VASRTPAIVPTSADSDGLVAEEQADEEWEVATATAPGSIHLAEGGAGRDIHDSSVVRPAGVIHDAGDLAELAADFDE